MRNNDICIILQKRHRFVTKAQARKCSESQKNNSQPIMRQTRWTDGGERHTVSEAEWEGEERGLLDPQGEERMKTLCFSVSGFLLSLLRQSPELHMGKPENGIPCECPCEFSAPRKDSL